MGRGECLGEIIHRIVIDGTINPAVGGFIHESIERSRADEAVALVIEMDTPGGLLSSTKTIVKDILGSPVPVIVYVAPSGAGAGSAGVFITMAAHVAAMAPGTNIGAAHPVGGGGQDIGTDMREKIESFTASFGEAIARRRGRNVKWAEKAVRESVSITESEALEENVIDIVARDVPDLLAQAQGREVEVGNARVTLDFKGGVAPQGRLRVVNLEMRLKHKVVNLLADPNIAYLLMMAGILGLYLEFSHPGLIFPGLAGGICLLLALTALQVLPINYTGLLLIFLGTGLLVAELFVPSFGILGVGGIVSLALGSLFLFDTPESDVVVDRSIILTVVACVSTVMLVVGSLAVRAWRQRPVSGAEGLVGEIGEVKARLAPRGKIWVHGEYWNAEGEAAQDVEVGEMVKVVGVEGMTLKVKRAAA